MDFTKSERETQFQQRVRDFMSAEVRPAALRYLRPLCRARVDIEMTRLFFFLKAADMMDRAGNKAAQCEIAMIKLQAPRMALRIIDDAIQAHGGAGVSGDFELAADWANARALRLADGPDEVHARAIARAEFRRHRDMTR
jgi:acyl-CoA dehydrogenase